MTSTVRTATTLLDTLADRHAYDESLNLDCAGSELSVANSSFA
jgi:hypothetical protein